MNPSPPEDSGLFFEIGYKVASVFLAFVAGVVTTTWTVASKFHGLNEKCNDLDTRVDNIEKQPVVTINECNLTRKGCGQVNDLQFKHGSEMFSELKSELKEIKDILREMNKS